ncbi:hypothetical protein POSPLADRAFT_1137032 [Postia placenta MAD-698-R-SB12]|uniref:Transcription initiation factor TFIID subunit 10 n=1 Tax=Postia placenta MAD-698-R-SB12 TaxID=670580 RepID=A0A1X6N6Q2_9APHY|nr:hypothetical protein POSPLADRAFT_1137032 [Postia placenta MAD-698-R-SB12]OSX64295.1 hypothetical protein POSPLADRAFT_1137032 [Postia placenta MAD-698-R-SB12]
MSTPYSDSPQNTGYYPTSVPSYAQVQHQQSTPAASQAASTSAQPQAAQQLSRQATEEARKDRTLAEFLLMLDDYEPLIPNEVTDYYLQRVGFDCEDVRLKRLLSLAAQKFVSDIAADAYQHARIRANAAGGRVRAQPGPSSARVGLHSYITGTFNLNAVQDKTKTTLMMEDLSAALSEYGITSRKPEFYM